jgi:hypothetical protein
MTFILPVTVCAAFDSVITSEKEESALNVAPVCCIVGTEEPEEPEEGPGGGPGGGPVGADIIKYTNIF